MPDALDVKKYFPILSLRYGWSTYSLKGASLGSMGEVAPALGIRNSKSAKPSKFGHGTTNSTE